MDVRTPIADRHGNRELYADTAREITSADRLAEVAAARGGSPSATG